MSKPEQNDANDPPVGLAERLKALGGPGVVVPPETDDAILAQARDHFAGFGRSRRILLFPRWLAAAAVLALCAWLGHLWLSAPSRPSVAREDINQDGRVDVLDAFALARRLKQGPENPALFDMNRDGVVDQRDIDVIAVQAVKLPKGAG